MKPEIQKPKVGVGIMILKNGKVLLGKRKGSHGEGEFAFPGGHLEYMESFANCAKEKLQKSVVSKLKIFVFSFSPTLQNTLQNITSILDFLPIGKVVNLKF